MSDLARFVRPLVWEGIGAGAGIARDGDDKVLSLYQRSRDGWHWVVVDSTHGTAPTAEAARAAAEAEWRRMALAEVSRYLDTEAMAASAAAISTSR